MLYDLHRHSQTMFHPGFSILSLCVVMHHFFERDTRCHCIYMKIPYDTLFCLEGICATSLKTGWAICLSPQHGTWFQGCLMFLLAGVIPFELETSIILQIEVPGRFPQIVRSKDAIFPNRCTSGTVKMADSGEGGRSRVAGRVWVLGGLKLVCRNSLRSFETRSKIYNQMSSHNCGHFL